MRAFMYRLALKMLFGDSAKYLMLVFGVMFATFLMTQQSSVFCGLMRWTTAIIKNVPAPIWVVETEVRQVNQTIAMRDTDLGRVRSVEGVEWAMPLYSGTQNVRLENGSLTVVQLIGIDSTTFAGAPTRMVEGHIEALRQPNAVIVDELALERLSPNPEQSLKMGDTFEINDQEARIVGICEAMRSFTGGPFVWTTYERALSYSPPQRKMLSAILVQPSPGKNAESVAAEIDKQTGLKAFTNSGFRSSDREFNTATIFWYVKNTGIPISFGTTVLVGFIVGVAISCQTFYLFVLDNLKHYGALKAMGASNRKLCLMLLTQVSVVGAVGYGIGLFLASMFAFAALKNGQPPFFMPDVIPFAVFGVILFICALASFLGILRVSLLDAAVVFRG
jgi:putative ABC transport system permease protein